MSGSKPLRGPQKAAILMLAMGEEYATRFFTRMHEDEIRDLSQAMSQLGTVPAHVVESICEEFAGQLGQAGHLIGSFESTERLLLKTLPPDRVNQIMEEIRGPAGRTMITTTAASTPVPRATTGGRFASAAAPNATTKSPIASVAYGGTNGVGADGVPPMVTRGVLLDMAAFLGVASLESQADFPRAAAALRGALARLGELSAARGALTGDMAAAAYFLKRLLLLAANLYHRKSSRLNSSFILALILHGSKPLLS
jgi:hypothetical protein